MAGKMKLLGTCRTHGPAVGWVVADVDGRGTQFGDSPSQKEADFFAEVQVLQRQLTDRRGRAGRAGSDECPGDGDTPRKTLDRNTWRLRTAGPGTSARTLGGALKPAGGFPFGRTKLPRSDAGPTW